jgi:PAS domain S-box-containing protein
MNSILKHLLDLRNIEYFVLAENLAILDASSGVSRFVESPMSIGQDIQALFPELIGVESLLQSVLDEEEPAFEMKAIARSPSLCEKASQKQALYFDLYVIRSSAIELVLFLEDVTERMVLEQSLVQNSNETNLLLSQISASQKYINQIISSMADALIVTQRSGIIKTVNPAAQRLLECDQTELIGRSIFDVIERLGIEGDSSFDSTETICQTQSGRRIPIEVLCAVIKTNVSEFQGFVYTIRDMTERKQAELAKQEFLAMISHEIRTPMNAVIGMAGLLRNSSLNTHQQDLVNTIHSSSHALLTILNDILDLSKLEAGKLELDHESFNLSDCIAAAVNLLTPSAIEKGIKLKLVADASLPQAIEGDSVRLRQILINLLSNAVKFTAEGAVTLRVTPIALSAQAIEIQFSVSDTGIGIPNHQLDRLFQSFSQVDSSITRQYGGTGLGLSLCKQLCEMMGGKIWVESEPGQGSTFSFTIATSIVTPALPYSEVQSSPLFNELQIDPQMGLKNPLRILLAEDHAINQKMVLMLLHRLGYEADVVTNGIDAIAALQRQDYDVVLMDVNMPEMDGLTATQRIRRKISERSQPRIIAMTASAMMGDRERCFDAGMDDYITKPFHLQDFVQALSHCHPQSPVVESLVPIIDPSALQEIEKMVGFNSSTSVSSFLTETIDEYLVDAPLFLDKIQGALQQSDSVTLHRAAHTLGTCSATLGATTLAGLCKDLELMAGQGILLGAMEKTTAAIATYQQVKVALRAERQRYHEKSQL